MDVFFKKEEEEEENPQEYPFRVCKRKINFNLH